MEKLRLIIVTPYGQLLSEDVDEVTAPGSEGEFGVLAGHMPFFTTLKIGILTYKAGGEQKYVFINSGYAEVTHDKVVIVADSAERAEDIDVERALRAKERAEERLRKMEEIDVARATAALERATTRIQLAQIRMPR
jgi:F-type H+-transporting ATPase subunit epsilon